MGLVLYPETTVDEGAGSVSMVTTRCVENAVKSSDSLEVSCSSGGVWGDEQPQCECIDDYIPDTDAGTCTGMKRLL